MKSPRHKKIELKNELGVMRFYFLIIITLCTISVTWAQNNVVATIDSGNRTSSMSNGIISITINSKGQVNSLIYNNKDLINAPNKGRFYFSYNDQAGYYELSPNEIRIQKQNDDYVEIVYSRTNGNLVIEQGFIMRKGVSGLYSYVLVKGTSSSVKLREMRLVYRVDPERFDYGYVSNQMQGFLPSVAVMKQVEANSIMDATYPLPDGSIYTKYNWANYNVLDSVHGIMSGTEGVWAIPVSNEYMNGGPMKQELTVHTTSKTPLVLQMLQGEHFGASSQTYGKSDEKIYGPFFIYVNSGEGRDEMIEDAKAQASLQKKQWPFQWFENNNYPIERTSVNGKIKLPQGFSPKGLQVVLAQPGVDIYAQGKEYMFWDKTDEQGNFSITNVRPGKYTLYAYSTQGEITEEYSKDDISVSGSSFDLGEIYWNPEKYEKMIWQIGDNNRLSDGYQYSDTTRNYGLYNLPPSNLEYIIGASSPEKDWYYAQTKEGSWIINFNIDEDLSGNAYLTASIAGAANSPSVSIYLNGSKQGTWSFSNDASIYRSAVLGGKHSVKKLVFPASLLVKGENQLKLTMTNSGNRGGVMYDCLKLEAGNLLTGVSDVENNEFKVRSYPNPFSDRSHIEFESDKKQKVRVDIFSSNGQHIMNLFNGYCNAGKNSFVWSCKQQNMGTYFYRVQLEKHVFTGKMILINN